MYRWESGLVAFGSHHTCLDEVELALAFVATAAAAVALPSPSVSSSQPITATAWGTTWSCAPSEPAQPSAPRVRKSASGRVE